MKFIEFYKDLNENESSKLHYEPINLQTALSELYCNKQPVLGYECTNIISNSVLNRSKGFIAASHERKLPCVLKLKFKEPVENLSSFSIDFLHSSKAKYIEIIFLAVKNQIIEKFQIEILKNESVINLSFNSDSKIYNSLVSRIEMHLKQVYGFPICIGPVAMSKTSIKKSSAVDSEDSRMVFLDQLTFEPMVKPFRLPSGLHIDASSLNRLNEYYKEYGIKPQDPFTGVIFTEAQKPELDIELMGKINGVG